jgi:hypothetical protein
MTIEGLDPGDVEQIDPDRPLEERLPRLAGEPDVRRPLADPEQVRLSDVVAGAVGHHDAERLERLLTQAVSELLGGHRLVSGWDKGIVPARPR